MSKLTDNIDKARAASRDKIETTKQRATEGTALAREKMSDSKQRAAALLGEGKAKAADGVAVTRDAARKAATKSEEAVAKSPLAIVAGGLALGAIFGALLRKTKTEDKYLGAAGRKINETAKTAYGAAKEAGQEQIDVLGLNTDSMRDQFKDMFGKAVEAAKSAAEAASDAVKAEKQDKS